MNTAIVNLTEVACVNCGIVMWVSKETDEVWRRKGMLFYCPNGHSMTYKDTDAKKISELTMQINNKDVELRRVRENRDEVLMQSERLERKIKRLQKKK